MQFIIVSDDVQHVTLTAAHSSLLETCQLPTFPCSIPEQLTGSSHPRHSSCSHTPVMKTFKLNSDCALIYFCAGLFKSQK